MASTSELLAGPADIDLRSTRASLVEATVEEVGPVTDIDFACEEVPTEDRRSRQWKCVYVGQLENGRNIVRCVTVTTTVFTGSRVPQQRMDYGPIGLLTER